MQVIYSYRVILQSNFTKLSEYSTFLRCGGKPTVKSTTLMLTSQFIGSTKWKSSVDMEECFIHCEG